MVGGDTNGTHGKGGYAASRRKDGSVKVWRG